MRIDETFMLFFVRMLVVKVEELAPFFKKREKKIGRKKWHNSEQRDPSRTLTKLISILDQLRHTELYLKTSRALCSSRYDIPRCLSI
jgi:hypothetical protein